MAKDAAIAIVVCGYPELDRVPQFWQQDCSIAAQNISIIPLAVIPIGKLAEKKEGNKRYLEDRAHINTW